MPSGNMTAAPTHLQLRPPRQRAPQRRRACVAHLVVAQVHVSQAHAAAQPVSQLCSHVWLDATVLQQQALHAAGGCQQVAQGNGSCGRGQGELLLGTAAGGGLLGSALLHACVWLCSRGNVCVQMVRDIVVAV